MAVEFGGIEVSKQVTQEGALAETALANACDVEGFDVLQLERLAIALGLSTVSRSAYFIIVSICKSRDCRRVRNRRFARYADGTHLRRQIDGEKFGHSPSVLVSAPLERARP